MSARVDRGPHERFMAYMRGWYAGAGRKAIDPNFSEHKTRPDLKEEYERGYSDGQAKGRAAAGKAAKRLGYTPTVLRVADGGVDREARSRIEFTAMGLRNMGVDAQRAADAAQIAEYEGKGDPAAHAECIVLAVEQREAFRGAGGEFRRRIREAAKR